MSVSYKSLHLTRLRRDIPALSNPKNIIADIEDTPQIRVAS